MARTESERSAFSETKTFLTEAAEKEITGYYTNHKRGGSQRSAYPQTKTFLSKTAEKETPQSKTKQ